MGLSKPRYASNLAFVVGDEDEPAALGCATILQVIVTDYYHSGAAAALIGVNRQRRGSSRPESRGCRLVALATPGYTNNGGVQRDFSTSILFNIKISAPDHGALTAA